ncbi:MAG TPA: response regulator [Vicinamibacterales bacterium]|nr:response regulator [Vicinamibacterales bacterium]
MRHKLLLADDSVTIQRVVELTFSGEDVHVVTVGDGEQAIARIPVEHPDIVLADIGMPKRSGYEVAAFVKGRPDLSHIPVLLLAGAFEPVDEARAQQVKSDGVLVKPFEPQQVISRVRELIDGSGRSKAGQTIEAAPAIAAAFETRMSDRAAELRSAASEARVPSAEPKAAASPARIPSPDPMIPSEDYFDFDRLDAAFARLGSEADPVEPMRGLRQREDYGAGFDVPTVDSLLASAPLPDMPAASIARAPLPSTALPLATRTSSTGGAPPRMESATPVAPNLGADAAATGGRNVIADVFSALFAAEQGESGSMPIRLARPAAPAVTEELIDEVTRRVVQRLASNAANDVVAQIVSEVTERLVREEIARIKSAVANRR